MSLVDFNIVSNIFGMSFLNNDYTHMPCNNDSSQPFIGLPFTYYGGLSFDTFTYNQPYSPINIDVSRLTVPTFNPTNYSFTSTTFPSCNFQSQIYPNINFSSNYMPTPDLNLQSASFSSNYMPTPDLNSSNKHTEVKSESSSTKSVKEQDKKTNKSFPHWSKMSDSELIEIYGNYAMDVTQKYKGDAQALNKYLVGKGVLEGKGQAFLDAQKKYGISAAVLVGICSHETGYGKSNLAIRKNNVGGIRKSGSKEFRTFNSVDECIDFMARLLKNNYVDNEGRSLCKLYQINAKYCPITDPTDKNCGNSIWAKSVTNIVKQIEAVA